MKIGVLVCVSYFSCLPCLLTVATVYLSLAGQTFAARGGKGGAREGGKRTSGHFRQVFVDVAGMLALPIRLESVQ